MTNTTPMECARIATTPKVEQRKLQFVVMKKELYMRKDYAKIATYQYITKTKEFQRKTLIVLSINLTLWFIQAHNEILISYRLKAESCY